MKRHDHFSVRNATENNLRSVSVDIPKNQLVVVTGVSGSGKSSLVFDVIFREAERRYLATFTTYARQFLQKTRKPNVEAITGLAPAIAIDQHAITRNPRSTVGTLTEIYDYLRLLYARVGKLDVRQAGSISPSGINRSLFSFNSPEGACPVCKGLGVEDRLDPDLLVKDPKKSIREGALVITAPNGYIIYSQVTLDVLNQVCEAEGFSVDIPWEKLNPYQRDIILYGSEIIEVPYGKHPLESRMRWSGITAKPREMGFYKGIIPVMQTILKRERNKNILRFVRTSKCSACNGNRLNEKALSVTIHGKPIDYMVSMQLNKLKQTLSGIQFTKTEKYISEPIVGKISMRIDTLEKLGLGYLSLNRDSTTLSAGESQRIRLAIQIGMGLQGLLYILDEPSIGLHPADSMKIIKALKILRDKGNSVIVVEHDEEFIRHADHLIDIGPEAGTNGGEVLINSPVSELSRLPPETIEKSETLQYLFRKIGKQVSKQKNTELQTHHLTKSPHQSITILGASLNNLKDIDVSFRTHAFNVVTGVSGAGKSSLVTGIIGKRLPGTYKEIIGWEKICKVIAIDQSPIGKTSRSNPATYTGLFDYIRDLFASLPSSKERGYRKTRFSFNTTGGRCEACQGAGFHQTGMHFLGTVEVLCSNCQGKQFDEQTLQIRYNGKNIAEVLDLSISEAVLFFHDHPKLVRSLKVMEELGLGYLHLGQRSSTLSGGEAQRVKLASELSRSDSNHTLYLLDEPTTGLHNADVERLLNAIQKLVHNHHTVIVIEHHPALILAADHIVDLGPGSGDEGGIVIATGSPGDVMKSPESITGQELRRQQGIEASTHQNKYTKSPHHHITKSPHHQITTSPHHHITISGATTNNLKGVSCKIPHNKITVITGASGSGKSSLAFDTLYAEGRNRFLESFSAYARSQIGIKEKPGFDEVSGLTPTFAVDQRDPGTNPRSTVGTFTGIYDLLRLLYARYASRDPVLSSLFSFNEQMGACPRCDGLGSIYTCSQAKLVTHPEKSLIAGALDGTKTGRFYGDPVGQYVSILKSVGSQHNIDFSKPWSELTVEQRKLAMEGTGDEIYDVTWQFKRKERTGEHHFKGKWIGFLALVNQEYERKHADHRGEDMKGLMQEICCTGCNGKRLNSEALSYLLKGKDIADTSKLPVTRLEGFLESLMNFFSEEEMVPATFLMNELQERTDLLIGMGLGYISLCRTVDSLSGGEFQRIKLAGQIGSGLTEITYVLDEPTAGLHPSDTMKLMERIEGLCSAGNTIVMVEHDPDVIRRADQVIDMGPGAGKEGGKIIASGTPEELQKNPLSVTGHYLMPNKLEVTSRNRFNKSASWDPGSLITVQEPQFPDPVS